MKKSNLFIVLSLSIFVLNAFGYQDNGHKILFEKAKYTMETKGDLKGAISLFEEIIQKYPSARDYAAKSQLYIGMCKEKLGMQEAIIEYQKVIENYPEQSDEVLVAKGKIAKLNFGENTITADGIIIKNVWAGLEANGIGAPSPDGRYLSIIDWRTFDLGIRNLSTGENKVLTKDENRPRFKEMALSSTWSSDGSKIAYEWFNEHKIWELRVYDLKTNKIRVLFSNKDFFVRGLGNWSNDGKYISTWLSMKNNRWKLGIISTIDGEFTEVKTGDWPPPQKNYFSPDGQYIAFDHSIDGSYKNDISIISINNNKEISVIKHPAHDFLIAWSPSGDKILFGSDRTGNIDIWSISINNGKPSGTEKIVKSNVGPISPLGITKDGTLFYDVLSKMSDVFIAEIDFSSGKILKAPQKISKNFEGKNTSSMLSHSGQVVAYISNRGTSFRTSSSVVCFSDLKTNKIKEFYSELDIQTFNILTWTKNDSCLLFSALNINKESGLYEMNVYSGKENLIYQGSKSEQITTWTNEGDIVFISNFDKKFDGVNNKIIRRDRIQNIDKEIYTGKRPSFVTPSPDGKFLAFRISETTSEKTVQKLILLSTTGGEQRSILTEEGENFYRIAWTHDSKHILLTKRCTDDTDNGWPLWVIPLDGREPIKTELSMQLLRDVSVHPDGKTIVFTGDTITNQGGVWAIENFLPK